MEQAGRVGSKPRLRPPSPQRRGASARLRRRIARVTCYNPPAPPASSMLSCGRPSPSFRQRKSGVGSAASPPPQIMNYEASSDGSVLLQWGRVPTLDAVQSAGYMNCILVSRTLGKSQTHEEHHHHTPSPNSTGAMGGWNAGQGNVDPKAPRVQTDPRALRNHTFKPEG